MAQLKARRAFEEWKSDPKNVDELFRLIVEERMGLRDAAIIGMKQSYTLMYEFLNDGGELQKRLEGAYAALADAIAHEALEIADEQCAVKKDDGTTYDPDVPRDKLRVETRLRLMPKWGRARYGDRVDHRHEHVIDLGERLRRASEREIESAPEQATPVLSGTDSPSALAPARAAVQRPEDVLI